MKKFMKNSAIIGGILLLTGFIIVIIGIAGGGIRDMRQKSVESIAALIEKCDFTWLTEWVEELDDLEGIEFMDEITISFGGNGSNDIIFNDGHELYTNGTYTFENMDASELELVVGAGSLEIKQHNEDYIKLVIGSGDSMQCFVEDGVLKIVGGLTNGINIGINVGINTGSDMVVYFPEDATYDEILVEVGAGNLVADTMSGERIVIDAGVGNVAIEDIFVNDLEVSVGLGNIEIEGCVNGDAMIDCGMGQISMELEGDAKAFDYELDCGMGALEVEGVFSIAGIGEQTIDNGAEKKLEASVGTGNVEIDFKE